MSGRWVDAWPATRSRLVTTSRSSTPTTDASPTSSRQGARGAAAVADAVRDAEVVDIVVLDAAQVDAVTRGSGGVLAHAAPGAVVAVHSTVHPATVQGVAEAAPEGVAVLDAPISGGVHGAETATLCVMVGGDPAVFERARPVFDSVGNLVVHVGPLGAGLGAKLARNLVGYIGMLSAREGVLAGDRGGRRPRRVPPDRRAHRRGEPDDEPDPRVGTRTRATTWTRW